MGIMVAYCKHKTICLNRTKPHQFNGNENGVVEMQIKFLETVLLHLSMVCVIPNKIVTLFLWPTTTTTTEYIPNMLNMRLGPNYVCCKNKSLACCWFNCLIYRWFSLFVPFWLFSTILFVVKWVISDVSSQMSHLFMHRYDMSRMVFLYKKLSVAQ